MNRFLFFSIFSFFVSTLFSNGVFMDKGGVGYSDKSQDTFAGSFDSNSEEKEASFTSFSLQGDSSKTCKTLTIIPEHKNKKMAKGYVFNVYRLRDGKIKQLGKTFASTDFKINGSKPHKKYVKPLILKNKNALKKNDKIILDGWHRPMGKKKKHAIFKSNRNRIQRCLNLQSFPSQCKLYMNDMGLTYSPSGELDDTFNFEGGITGCGEPELLALKDYLKSKE